MSRPRFKSKMDSKLEEALERRTLLLPRMDVTTRVTGRRRADKVKQNLGGGKKVLLDLRWSQEEELP